MNKNHEIGCSNEPRRPFEADEHVVRDVLSEGPVADKGHRKITNGVDEISPNGAPPHGNPGWLVRGGRNRGLNLQNHRMASVRRRDYAQRVEHAEHAVDVACFLVGVAHVWDSASAQAADPGYA